MAELGAQAAELETREEFAQALTRMREGRGLTVRGVVAAADVPVATVGGYLSGRHLPPLAATDQVECVLRVLGVNPGESASWVAVSPALRSRQPPRSCPGSV